MKPAGWVIERCSAPAPPPAGAARRPRCAFTIDVEDWYQSSVDFDAPITDRVLRNMELVRAVLDDFGVKTTFFVQGRVAETFPGLLRELLAAGHEIQSHAYSHRPLFAMDREALRRELEYSRKTVEDACGVRVTAFRAPDFSIVKENLWALEVLAECGFEVDSSIFPIKTHRYGVAGWETAPHRVTFPSGRVILEVPVAVGSLAGLALPIAGGGYFRLLPAFLLERAISAALADGRPAVLYAHPYEFNPGEMHEYRGRVSAYLRFQQGVGRSSLVRRVRHLLSRMRFGRLDEVLADWRSVPASR